MATLDQISIATPGQGVSGPSGTITLTTNVTISANGFIVLEVWWFGLSTLPSITITGTNGLTWQVDKVGANSTAYGSAILSAQAPAGLASGKTIIVNYNDTPSEQYAWGKSLTGVATPTNIVGSGALNVSPTSIVAASTANTPTAACSIHGTMNIDTLTGTTNQWSPGGAGTTPTTGWLESQDFGNTTAGASFGSVYRLNGLSGTSYAPGGAANATGTACAMHVAYADGGAVAASGILPSRRSFPRRGKKRLGFRAYRRTQWIDGSVVTSSFPVTDEDLTPTMADIASMFAAIPDTDANGATTEVANLAASESSTDANGVTTEASTVTVPVTDTDANSTTTESTSVRQSLTDTDANGATTEAQNLVVAESVTDANGTTTEVVKLALTGTDANGAVTESVTEVAQIPSTDANGSPVEVAGIGIPTSDANGTTTEVTTLVAALAGTDAGTDAEVAKISETTADANGATTEVANAAIAVSGSDANGAVTEVTSLLVAESAPEAATDSETATLVAAIPATDSGSDTEAATPNKQTPDSNGVTTEAANISVPVATTDVNGATTEATSLLAKPTGTDTGSDSESATIVASATTQDSSTGPVESAAVVYKPNVTDQSGATSESASVHVFASAVDFNSTTTETTATVVNITSQDIGSITELSALKALLAGSDTGTAATVGGVGVLGTDTCHGSDTQQTRLFIIDSDANGLFYEDALATFIGRLIKPGAEHEIASAESERAVLASATLPADTRVSVRSDVGKLLGTRQDSPTLAGADNETDPMTGAK